MPCVLPVTWWAAGYDTAYFYNVVADGRELCSHADLRKVEAQEGSCSSGGNPVYWRCFDCAAFFADGEGQRRIARINTLLPPAEHSYHAAVTVPTCTAEGYTTYVCTGCGHSYAADPVAALGHTFLHGVCVTCGQKDPDALPENPFTDVKDGDYYHTPILWAVKMGITNGATATTFAPEKGCTRGQIVTFLYRAVA